MSEASQKKLGKYQIRKELGKGAMGVVYTGFDPALEREVALKVMASAIVSDEDLKVRFEKEAKSVAKLQHPNIVTVYDLGYDEEGDGAPFIAMELLKGADLEERIRKDPLTFREKLEVVSKVCRGLAHAHKNGIVHRDIKPANVFVTQSGEVKIMDFGVARWAQSSNTQTGAILGTADYMSPEQIRGQRVDGRSDIFSVGVILYRLLTNKKPFAGDNIQAVFFKVLNQPAPPLQLPDGTELPELQQIVNKALSKDANVRYANADDLADDLLDLVRLYEDLVTENTVFDTMYDPAAVSGEHSMSSSSPGSDAPGTSSPSRVLGPGSGSHTRRGTMGSTAPGRTHGGTVGRTAAAPTSMGRTAASRTGVSRPGVTRAGTMSGSGVGIPLQESSPLPKILAAVVLVAGLGFGAYWFGLREPVSTSPPVEAVSPPGPVALTAEQVDAFLSEAEGFLEGGQLNRAMARVDEVLKLERDNVRAKLLEERILERQQLENEEPTPVASAPPDEEPAPRPPPPPVDVAPSGPTNETRAAKIAMDASLAIGDGDFARAGQLINDGRRLTPNDPAWSDLRDRLDRSKAEADSEARVAALLTAAGRHIENEDYQAAIEKLDEGLQIDPNNAALAGLRAQAAADLKRVQSAPVVSARQIQYTATTYTAGPDEVEAPRGFDMGGAQGVKRATSAPKFPGEITLTLNPPNAQTGNPYRLQISLTNRGNTPVTMENLELVSTYDGKTMGRGQKLPPKSKVVPPNGTVVVWETTGTWQENQNRGTIAATIFLNNGATLSKSMTW